MDDADDKYLPRVCVCVATYKRPEYLRRLLDSLVRIQVPQSRVEFLIADNDGEESAKDTVITFAERNPHPVHYIVESRRGIATIRNRLVHEALQRAADYIVFVDDDVVVKPNWLTALFDTAVRWNADAVAGPYPAIFEDDVPEWYRKSGILLRPKRTTTGTRIRYASTANVLFRSDALRQISGPFDTRMNLSGGSDTLLFERMHYAGMLAVWCDEALAFEHWPASRTTLSFVLKRHYRDGVVSAKLTLWVRSSPTKVAVRVLKSTAIVLMHIAVMPFGLSKGRAGWVPRAAGIARGLGGLIGLLTPLDRHAEYRQIHGR